jgi:hypothetical protein
MAVQCERCGFNFEELRLTLYVRDLLEVKRIVGERVCLRCPACGVESWLDLTHHGIFYSGERLYRWRSATTTLISGGYQIQIGSMILEIPQERMEVISVQDICYPAVPVFRQIDGSLSIPKWPVKREYLGLIDTEKDVQLEIRQDRYITRLHLKGLERSEEITLPLIPVQRGRAPQGENAVFPGVHLVLWPDVPYKEWKRYFLRFGCTSESEEVRNRLRNVTVYAYAKENPGSQKDWVPINKVASDGCTRFRCVESRPEWIAIEFESGGRVEGGGIWAIEPANESYPEMHTTIAVDFGTSNTFVGWIDINVQGEDRERPLPIQSCDKFIIHGSDLPAEIDFADTWPPRQGFGRDRALLPSEILTRERLNELRLHVRDIEKWKPVEDYGIPSSGLELRYSEAEHIIAEFKWKDMIPDEAFRGHAEKLQRRYLEFLLLFALAQLAVKRSIGKSVDVKFSYPLAFNKEEDLPAFESVLREAAQSVNEQTGITIAKEVPMDEARAAASSMGQLSPDYSAFLYVDIGGGSSDIALELVGEKRGRRYAYIASFQYAGGGLVHALAGGDCLMPNFDLSKFRRMIREVGQVTELMRMGTVFHPRKTNLINAKIFYFYSYLMEFIARLLAAHIITGEWAKGLTDKEKEEAKQNGYLVALYPLGNGWGFGHFIDPRYARDVFSGKLMDRANQILEEAIQKGVASQDIPRLIVKGQDLRIADPKSAVAFGLLKETSHTAGEKEKEEDWSFRTIVGWTTRVGKTRKIPWFLPITDRANPKLDELLKDQEPLPPNPILDCPEDEWPLFPERLPTPHLLDPGLNETRRHLLDPSRGCIQTGKDWFVQSPFHILLEKLFKPKLKRLA